MPTHDELARFKRQFNKLPVAVREAFIVVVLALAADLGDAGFDPTSVRPSLRLHKLTDQDVWSVSFAGRYRAVFRLGSSSSPDTLTSCGSSSAPTRSTTASTESASLAEDGVTAYTPAGAPIGGSGASAAARMRAMWVWSRALTVAGSGGAQPRWRGHPPGCGGGGDVGD